MGAERPDVTLHLTVMTWNLYLGADLTRALEATSREELLAANAEVFRVVHETSFPERARVVARWIVEAGPAIVGLQEAAAWLTGPLDGPTPATTVELDYIRILEGELARLGAPYEVVSVQPETDTEGPAGEPYLRNTRLLDRDAILVRADLARDVRATGAGHFEHQHTIATGTGQTVVVTRGWISADLTISGRPLRFVNTHLEAFDAQVRRAQAEELVSATGPIGSANGGVVLLGDLNTGPELPVPENREAFFVLLESGLADSWAELHPRDPGYTAGFGELLDDPSPSILQHRVDHVMTKGGVTATSSRVVGTTPADRTPTGLWPSDHAGLLASLRA